MSVEANEPAGSPIAWRLFIALVFVLPLVLTNISSHTTALVVLSYDPFQLGKAVLLQAGIAVVLAVWAWEAWRSHGARIKTHATLWMGLGLLSCAVIATFLGVHPPTAIVGAYGRFEGLASMSAYLAVGFAALQLVTTSARVRTFVTAVAASGVLVALYGLVQSVGADPSVWSGAFEQGMASSTMGNPDLYGAYLVVPLSVALGSALAEATTWRRACWWTAVFVILAGVVVSYSRGAWLGATVSLIFISVAAARRAPRQNRVLDAGFGLAALAGLVVFIVRSSHSNGAVTNVWTRLLSSFDITGGSVGMRLQAWEAALRATAARPLFGFGPDSFSYAFALYKPAGAAKEAATRSVADNAHNVILQTTATLGLPAAVLLITLVVSVGIAFNRTLRGAPATAAVVRWYGLGGALVGYMVAMLTGLSVPGAAAIFWACVGVIVVPLATTRPVSARTPFVALVTGVSLLAVALAGCELAADGFYYRAWAARKIPVSRDAYVATAIRLNPLVTRYRDSQARWIASDTWSVMQRAVGAGSAERQTALVQADHAAAVARDTLSFNPADFDMRLLLAQLYNLRARVEGGIGADRALEQAESALLAEPRNAAARYEAAVALLMMGREGEASVRLREALEIDPSYSDATSLLSQLPGVSSTSGVK